MQIKFQLKHVVITFHEYVEVNVSEIVLNVIFFPPT